MVGMAMVNYDRKLLKYGKLWSTVGKLWLGVVRIYWKEKWQGKIRSTCGGEGGGGGGGENQLKFWGVVVHSIEMICQR